MKHPQQFNWSRTFQSQVLYCAMLGVRYSWVVVLALVGGATAEDNISIDIIEDDTNSTGMENMDVDTMVIGHDTNIDTSIDKFNSSIEDTNYIIMEDIVYNETTEAEDFTNLDHNNETLLDGICGNSSLLEHMNVTKHRGIVHGFSEYRHSEN